MSTEIITAAEAADAELRQHADTINDAINLIVSHEEAFQEAALEPCLIIGREIEKARSVFALGTRDRTAPATLSRRDNVDHAAVEIGFSSWLRKEIPRLKHPTAYKYATCFKALGLPETAADAKITAKIKDLRHAAGRDGQPMPSLASLYRAGKPAKDAPRLPAHQPTMEDCAGEARVSFHEWMRSWDRLVTTGHLEPLAKKDLEPIEQFLTTCRDQVRARIKTTR